MQNSNYVNYEKKDVRERLVDALSRYGYKQVDVSKETGIHHSTLSLWLQGKVKGHNVGIEETIEEWLQNLYATKPCFSSDYSTKFFQIQNNPILKSQLEEKDIVVPIRIDLESDDRKYKEYLLWNLNEPFFTPETFAKQLVEDNNLSAIMEEEVVRLIKRAIDNHLPPSRNHSECIKTLEINVRIDNIGFNDRFEWDINDKNNSPEDFSILLCNEIGLNSQFATLIAQQIREQITSFKRAQTISSTQDDYYFMNSRLKKARGTIGDFSKMEQKSRKEPVNTENYLRPVYKVNYNGTDNLDYWEPSIQMLSQAEIRKHEEFEERKYRHERRDRVKKYYQVVFDLG